MVHGRGWGTSSGGSGNIILTQALPMKLGDPDSSLLLEHFVPFVFSFSGRLPHPPLPQPRLSAEGVPLSLPLLKATHGPGTSLVLFVSSK